VTVSRYQIVAPKQLRPTSPVGDFPGS